MDRGVRPPTFSSIASPDRALVQLCDSSNRRHPIPRSAVSPKEGLLYDQITFQNLRHCAVLYIADGARSVHFSEPASLNRSVGHLRKFRQVRHPASTKRSSTDSITAICVSNASSIQRGSIFGRHPGRTHLAKGSRNRLCGRTDILGAYGKAGVDVRRVPNAQEIQEGQGKADTSSGQSSRNQLRSTISRYLCRQAYCPLLGTLELDFLVRCYAPSPRR